MTTRPPEQCSECVEYRARAPAGPREEATRLDIRPIHPTLLMDPLALGLGDLGDIRLPAPEHPAHEPWLRAVEAETGARPRLHPLTADERLPLSERLRAEAGTLGTARVIAVDGPAGAGRSSVVRGIATIAAGAGLRVAALDCDLNHPGLLELYGITAPPVVVHDLVLAQAAQGVRLQSLGAFWPEPGPLPWHGRELQRVLDRFARDVLWGRPDLLLLDLPAIPDPRGVEISAFFGAERWEVSGPTATACRRPPAVHAIRNALSGRGDGGIPYLAEGDFFETFCTRLSGVLPPSFTKGFSSSR